MIRDIGRIGNFGRLMEIQRMVLMLPPHPGIGRFFGGGRTFRKWTRQRSTHLRESNSTAPALFERPLGLPAGFRSKLLLQL